MGLMRTLFLTLSFLAVAASAQNLPYERVESLNPPVPDGWSMPLAVSDSGWSLIQSQAPNLTSPPRYPNQYFFRSPEGDLSRIPLGLNGDITYLNQGGVISDNGRFAVLGGGAPTLLLIDRVTLEVRRIPYAGGSPFALVGRRVFLNSVNGGFSSMDLDTGQTKSYPTPPELFPLQPVRLMANGTRAIYQTGGGPGSNSIFYVQNLSTGKFRVWKAPEESSERVLDGSGRYVWMVVLSGEGQRLVRYDLLEEAEKTYPYRAGDQARLVAASERYAFFLTPRALVPNDGNTTPDVYAFDRTTEKLSLLSTRQNSPLAAGDVLSFYASPDGSRTFFLSDSPLASDLSRNPWAQLYARSTSVRNTAPALAASSPAGGDGVNGVLSFNGSATLWLRHWEGQWSLRTVVAKKPVLVIPVPQEAWPWDVSDDGTLALWSNGDRKDLRFMRRGESISLDVRGGTVLQAHVEAKTGVPIAIVERGAGANLSIVLLKFDPLRGASRRIDEGAPIWGRDFAAAGGRVAWSTEIGVRVLDLATNAALDLSRTSGAQQFSPRLTGDGLKLGVAEVNSDQAARPLQTLLYRLPDGKPLPSTYFGQLSADGVWVNDPHTKELVYLKTGARIPSGMLSNLELPGVAVGPTMVHHRLSYVLDQGSVGDVWRYQAVAVPYPMTSYFYATAGPKGWVQLRGGFRKAGLENARTWIEYRVDGAGEWKRLKTEPEEWPTTFRLSDGAHLLEARAVDALGRRESETNPYLVVVDATPPSVSDVRSEKFDTGYRLMATTDADYANVTVVYPDGNVLEIKSIYPQQGKLTAYSPFSQKGTYTFYFQVFDRVGNSARSIKKTFTVD